MFVKRAQFLRSKTIMRLKGNRCGRQASKLQTTKLEAMSSKSQNVVSLRFSLSLSLRVNQIEKLLLRLLLLVFSYVGKQ